MQAVRRFRDLAARAWAPVAGLALLLILQEIHVIVVKHEASDDAAGAYAAAAVAAKGIIWVAVGLGLYLLPEAARRTKSGIDARPVLVRTLVLIGAARAADGARVRRGGPAAARDRVRRELRPRRRRAAVARHVDGAARVRATSRCSTCWRVGNARFIVVLGIAAAAEPLLLLLIGAQLRDVALALFGLQLALALVVTTISFRSAAHPDAAPVRGRLAV